MYVAISKISLAFLITIMQIRFYFIIEDVYIILSASHNKIIKPFFSRSLNVFTAYLNPKVE